MAKKDRKKQGKVKVKRKSWYTVESPTLFGSKQIGESYLSAPEKAVGRVMTLNLKNLTDSFRDQNSHITLKINNLKGTTLQTEVVGFHIVPTFIKRLVRKKTSRLDDVFTVSTKDGKVVMVKSLVVAFNRNTRSTGTSIRTALRDALRVEAQKQSFDEFVNSVVTSRARQGLKKGLKKIYPIKEVFIRYFKVVDSKDVAMEVQEAQESLEEELSQEETSEEVETQEESDQSEEEPSSEEALEVEDQDEDDENTLEEVEEVEESSEESDSAEEKADE